MNLVSIYIYKHTLTYINVHISGHNARYFSNYGLKSKRFTDPRAEDNITGLLYALPASIQRTVILSIHVKRPEFRALGLDPSKIIRFICIQGHTRVPTLVSRGIVRIGSQKCDLLISIGSSYNPKAMSSV